MSQSALVDAIKQKNSQFDEALVKRAYAYAEKAHEGQKRASGEPYFSHPLEVARMTAGVLPQGDAVAAALLHDTVEDTQVSLSAIEETFGGQVRSLVDGLTKIKALANVSKEASEAQSVRKLLLASINDVRVLIIKLADRLHNIRTLEHVKSKARRRDFCRETLDIYAALASYMGMMYVSEEFEDHAFKVLHPRRYEIISEHLRSGAERFREQSERAEASIRKELANQGIDAEVTSRVKRAYSIYRKSRARRISFKKMGDIYGFRVIVDDVLACYTTLGILHTQNKIVPGGFRDYISSPKINGYQSLHTAIVGMNGEFIEFQIRTYRMHEVAEFGIASHAAYKYEVENRARAESGISAKRSNAAESYSTGQAFRTLREKVRHITEDAASSEEFVEHAKLELFNEQVFAFTPQGDMIILPRGASAIDFAYAVHTDIGNQCLGCKINGRYEPLRTRVKNGDRVEIFTTQDQSGPNERWLEFAHSGKARHEIKRSVRQKKRKEAMAMGRHMLKSQFEANGKTYRDSAVQAVLEKVAEVNDLEALFCGVADQSLSAYDLYLLVHPADKTGLEGMNLSEQGVGRDWRAVNGIAGLRFHLPRWSPHAEEATVDQVRKVQFAQGARPLPGERIVGILQVPKSVITIYALSDRRLKCFENDSKVRWVDVRWQGDEITERTEARLRLHSLNQPGSLKAIADVIAEHDGNIDGLVMEPKSTNLHEIEIRLAVWSFKHLTAIMRQLKVKASIVLLERKGMS